MDSFSCCFSISHILLLDFSGILNPDFYFSFSIVAQLIALICLLLISGFLSGAETAFFSITPAQLLDLKESDDSREKKIYILLSSPKRLLATLLISINFINIANVILSTLITSLVFNVEANHTLGFILQVVVVTFVIVLFCEVMPKVYATQNALRFASFTAIPVFLIDKILRPLSWLLVSSTSIVDRYVNKKGYDISVDELSHAIDITSDKDTPEEEKKILKGIARFGNIDVKQIMKQRMDVHAFDAIESIDDILPKILEYRYSRIPVYENSLDNIKGILYIKDLLPYLDNRPDNFRWQDLLRPAYFVPESKKINDLLQEFQEKKMHLSIVVDEYGGSSGIVTLEDILEEIVGEINDEFDDDELFYSKLDDTNFVFEGKTLLNDVCRVMEVDRSLFDIENEEVETLAGLILELTGSIPQKNQELSFNNMTFTVESADRKRIKRVKISLPQLQEKESGDKNKSGTGSSLHFLALLFGIFSIALTSCDETFTPKPKGFFRISLPEKSYSTFNPESCPFSFDIPAYAKIVLDTSSNTEPCWMNLDFPELNGTLYLSYKQINNNLAQYTEDSRNLSMKHITRASGIEELPVFIPAKKVYGTYYIVKGSAASPVQFYLTDSTKNFIRGALYFYASPQPDSIAPVLDFISKDIDHLIETFSWK